MLPYRKLKHVVNKVPSLQGLDSRRDDTLLTAGFDL
jgi:hypothetical protein